MLKSDQNGIEIQFHFSFSTSSFFVKIRPKWDWNLKVEYNKKTELPVKIRPKWDWNIILISIFILSSCG